jgi:hypothetical protein
LGCWFEHCHNHTIRLPHANIFVHPKYVAPFFTIAALPPETASAILGKHIMVALTGKHSDNPGRWTEVCELLSCSNGTFPQFQRKPVFLTELPLLLNSNCSRTTSVFFFWSTAFPKPNAPT